MKTWRISLLGSLALLAAIACHSQVDQSIQAVPWRSDYAAARQEAASSGKPLFVDFTATWCGPCQHMKQTTWSDKTVAQALDKYVPLQIDIDAHRDVAEKFHIDAVPTLMVIDAKDDRAVKTTQGAMLPEEFLAWLGR